MADQFYLITDSNAEEVRALTGLDGHNTSLGVLVKKPPPIRDIYDALFHINEALNPSPKCTCGRGRRAMFHKLGCQLDNTGV